MKVHEEEGPQSKVHEENRKWFRMKCDIETRCESSGEEWACKIVNFSKDGLGIVSARPLCEGDSINIHEADAVAEVVWTKGDSAGLKIRK
jgi:hypothetical protein